MTENDCSQETVTAPVTSVIMNEASVTRRNIIPESRLAVARRKLEQHHDYDAYSMICTCVRRCLTYARHDEASLLCHTFGIELLKRERYDLCAELGCLMVEVYTEYDLPATQERAQCILELFDPAPPTTVVERHRFIENALKWVVKVAGTESEYALRFHRAAGVNYQREKLFGKAQNHFIFCHDGELLGQLLVEWRKQGYPSERDLFVLRLVLLLLAKGDVQTAESTLHSRALDFNFDSLAVSPAIQLAYLLVEAVKDKNVGFFDLLTSKYSLVLRRDKLYSSLLEIIDRKVLGRQPSNEGLNILNMFSTMFGGAL